MTIRIATWNVNSIKARLPNVLDWLDSARPDVVLMQELKCTDDSFPAAEIESRGYHLAVHGQKTYNGVAILSRLPIGAVVRGLPGDPEQGEARHIEAVLENGLRVMSVYVPMGQSRESDRFPFKLAFLDALIGRAAALLAQPHPFVLGGDLNIAPEPGDVWDPAACDDLHPLYNPETRDRFRRLLHLGLTDAVRALDRRPGLFSWWDYRGGAWPRDMGMRIDHLLLSPRAADRLEAAGIDREPRGRDKCSDHTPVWCVLGEF